MEARRGIAAAGNFIIDHVKILDRLPDEETLAIILEQSLGTGGGPSNVLCDLAVLDPSLPLLAVGVIGNDADGATIVERHSALGIDMSQMRRTDEAPTSYTDVMTVKATGRRTFFHNYGANALLAPDDFCFDRIPSRILHLAYLMLLNTLDAPDETRPGRTRAARLLEEASRKGLLTSIDLVSDLGPRINEVVRPVLPFVDYFCANELETAAVTGIPARDSSGSLLRENLTNIAQALISFGVRQHVVIHAPEGGLWMQADGRTFFMPSLKVPREFITGTVGAGDAFCAGVLYGLHEGWSPEQCMKLAVCNAAQCLGHPTSTGGIRPLNETLALAERFGFRE